ncbi:hypothetical protein Rsub_09955 [Raphidocelis subcapitata]|uniref:Protein kinase domain-containing protein n=1 Tax=Raphidocelis subcapitata TaxID=307507 RepID=A0A2V0PBM9_9CHLO|nr:hypothetical protein Rsub_09955 [Raphidocelis subcapitata]|eukprot:GBF97264.1 hypothetical protein Rsub_09955 [Raphidocelis subcapitata]
MGTLIYPRGIMELPDCFLDFDASEVLEERPTQMVSLVPASSERTGLVANVVLKCVSKAALDTSRGLRAQVMNEALVHRVLGTRRCRRLGLAPMMMAQYGDDGNLTLAYQYVGKSLSKLFGTASPAVLGGRHPRDVPPADSWRALRMSTRLHGSSGPFADVLQCLEGMHREGIAHRDVKPCNFCQDAHTGRVWAIDAGLMHLSRAPRGVPAEALGGGPPPVGCTRAYAAPEVLLWFEGEAWPSEALGPLAAELEAYAVSPAGDVWGAGVALYTMLHGVHPFGDPWSGADECATPLLDSVVGAAPWVHPWLPAPLRDLLGALLTKNPDARPPLSELRGHPWVRAAARARRDARFREAAADGLRAQIAAHAARAEEEADARSDEEEMDARSDEDEADAPLPWRAAATEGAVPRAALLPLPPAVRAATAPAQAGGLWSATCAALPPASPCEELSQPADDDGGEGAAEDAAARAAVEARAAQLRAESRALAGRERELAARAAAATERDGTIDGKEKELAEREARLSAERAGLERGHAKLLARSAALGAALEVANSALGSRAEQALRTAEAAAKRRAELEARRDALCCLRAQLVAKAQAVEEARQSCERLRSAAVAADGPAARDGCAPAAGNARRKGRGASFKKLAKAFGKALLSTNEGWASAGDDRPPGNDGSGSCAETTPRSGAGPQAAASEVSQQPRGSAVGCVPILQLLFGGGGGRGRSKKAAACAIHASSGSGGSNPSLSSGCGSQQSDASQGDCLAIVVVAEAAPGAGAAEAADASLHKRAGCDGKTQGRSGKAAFADTMSKVRRMFTRRPHCAAPSP